MAEALFYIIGIAIVVVALVVSFVGIRNERFPGSNRVMALIAAGVAALVVGVAVTGVILAREEKEHRLEERAQFAEEQAAAEGPEEVTEEPAPDEAPGPAAEGQQLFTDTCGICHTLADAGTTSEIAPDLDSDVPQASDEEFVRETILDPPPGMAIPELPDDQVDAIAAYVSSVAGE